MFIKVTEQNSGKNKDRKVKSFEVGLKVKKCEKKLSLFVNPAMIIEQVFLLGNCLLQDKLSLLKIICVIKPVAVQKE